MDDELKWYVATRRDSKAHCIFNENYLEEYANEFERIREYDTAEEAKEAYDARVKADSIVKSETKVKSRIASAKVRGDIKKGSMEDEALREQIKAELRIELEAELNKSKDTGAATMGAKTRARSSKKTEE